MSIMTNSDRRKFYREHGIDIEVTVVVKAEGNGFVHTGNYRFTLTKFDEQRRLVKNFYAKNVYPSYEDAENAALTLAVAVFEGREENQRNKYM